MTDVSTQQKKDFDEACSAIKTTTILLRASGVDEATLFAATWAIMLENLINIHGKDEAQSRINVMYKGFFGRNIKS